MEQREADSGKREKWRFRPKLVADGGIWNLDMNMELRNHVKTQRWEAASFRFCFLLCAVCAV